MATPTRSISIFNDGEVLSSVISAPHPPENQNFYVVLGDEELARFNYRSRTEMPDWGYLPQTPSVFRFDKEPQEPTEHRVDVTAQDAELRRLNLYDGKRARIEYLYSAGTALFNRTGFPKLQYLTMSFNVLEKIEVVNNSKGKFLKFRTLVPNSNTSGMTHTSHPQFVHKLDIVTFDNGFTNHVNTPHGDVFWFLTTKEGYGYIPMDVVRPA